MYEFADQIHIIRIREALWQRPELGRASVMVGAGFSCNAIGNVQTAAAFPTWSQISKLLADKLYPLRHAEGGNDEHISQTGAASDVPRLAEEFEVVFGRDALDSLLLSAIPDTHSQPSDLHRKLLELPWADVLTTNYDTLLERAAATIPYRKYDAVRTNADIPMAMRPRIVKLNGSFPSTRPFIITEEDFRTYPVRFAPFVNLAQQAAMETILCLIGFSGDDPNFLNWTGWVRDNLGESSPKIYLFGILNLSDARKQLLQRRNVVPVDLSPMIPMPNGTDSALRHYRALEWLFENFAVNDDAIELDWPSESQSHISTKTRSPNIPPLIGTSRKRPPSMPISNRQGCSTLELIRDILPVWQGEREQYPGWLIAPESVREPLWQLTRTWAAAIMRDLSSVPANTRFQFLYELNWRLERCLLPLWSELDMAITEVLDLVPTLSQKSGLDKPSGIVLDIYNQQSLFEPTVATMWIDLAFALLRSARENRDSGGFERWKKRLTDLEVDDPRIHARLRYERCLWTLGQLDYASVGSIVNEWSINSEDPFWQIRRAAVLAEIGDITTAIREAEAGLSEIRARIRPDGRDIFFLSREGWAMMLTGHLTFADRMENRRDKLAEFIPRWHKLAASKCDPWPDRKLLETRLEGKRPRLSPAVTVKHSLDGTTTRTTHIGSTGIGPKLIPAYQFMRLMEDAALPPRCGIIQISGGALAPACRWIEDESPALALSNLLRLASDEEIRRYLSPERVALLPDQEFARIFALFHGAASSLGSATDDTKDRIKVVIAGLCALMPRLGSSDIEGVLRLAISYYSLLLFRANFQLYQPLSELFRASLKCAPGQLIAKMVLDLIKLPIPSVDQFTVYVAPMANDWPEPCMYVWSQIASCLSRLDNDDRWSAAVSALLHAAREGSTIARQRGIYRLATLHYTGLLTQGEQDRFGEALWQKVDDATGLPSDTGLYDSAFLRLPSPEPEQALKLLRRNCQRDEIDDLTQKTIGTDGRENTAIAGGVQELRLRTLLKVTRVLWNPPPDNDPRIDWNSEEAYQIFSKIENWWNREGEVLSKRLQRNSGPQISSISERFQLIAVVLAQVILPRVLVTDPRYLILCEFISQLMSVDVRAEALMPFLMNGSTMSVDSTASKIRTRMASIELDDVKTAMDAVFYWIWGTKSGKLPAIPEDLINEMGNIISDRRQPGLLSAMQQVQQIATLYPEYINATLLKSVEIGLEYLLKETAYVLADDLTNRPVPVHEIAIYRRTGGCLALAIMKLDPVPAICLNWREAIASDPLVYVRNSFPPAQN